MTDNSASRHLVSRWSNAGEVHGVEDTVAEEVPIALVYNDISYAVMMASPADFEDFAVGFSFTEGLIERAGEVYSVQAEQHHNGIELKLTVSSRVANRLQRRTRLRVGDSGCGICGVEALEQVQRQPRKVNSQVLGHQAIQRAVANLSAAQPLNSQTGAVHAAAWCDQAGDVLSVREDVGRHNALDKLIGHRLRTAAQTPGFVLVSSRASYEMVYKATQAGCGALVALSGATALAISVASAAELTLVGFARTGKHVIYSGKVRA